MQAPRETWLLLLLLYVIVVVVGVVVFKQLAHKKKVTVWEDLEFLSGRRVR